MTEQFLFATSDKGNTTSRSCSFAGSGVASGDKAVLFVGFADSGGQTITTDPASAGWTLIPGTVFTDDSGNVAGQAWYKDCSGSETTVVVGFSAQCKAVLMLWVGRGFPAGAPNIASLVAEGATSTQDHVAPTVTSTSNGWRITAIVDKATTATTAWTQPTGDSKRTEQYNTGGGATTGFLSDSAAQVASGTVTGGTGHADQSTANAVKLTVVLAVSSAPSAVQPTVALADASAPTPAVLGTRQTGTPTSDVTVTNWTFVGATSAWDATNDPTATPDDDTSYARSPNNPVAAVLEVKVTGIVDPHIDDSHVLTVRMRSEIAPMPCTVQLVQGAQIIATYSITTTTSYVTSKLAVSPAQVAAITDYTDLRCRITANG